MSLKFTAPIFLTLIVAGLLSGATVALAQYGSSCSDQYGLMSMEDILTGNCTCMSGYVFGKGVLGETQCVSGDSVCHDKYGYNSRYDSLSNSCECSYGYSFGKDSIGRTQCISHNEQCRDQLGYSARYNSLYDACECGYGEVISGGSCVDADRLCRQKHGYNSSYVSYSESCKCDDGYTFDDDNQCVEKQNNVYFRLLDLDTDTNEAIIESDYDKRNYKITYGSGCRSYSFERYLNKDIVVNLGTDFDVDRYDRIVLQDHDQVCDIRDREKIYVDTLREWRIDNGLLEDDESSDEEVAALYALYLAQETNVNLPTSGTETLAQDASANSAVPTRIAYKPFEYSKTDLTEKQVAKTISRSNVRICPSSSHSDCEIAKTLPAGEKVEVKATHESWYETDSGWVYGPLLDFNFVEDDEEDSFDDEVDIEPEANTEKEEKAAAGLFQRIKSWWKGIFE